MSGDKMVVNGEDGKFISDFWLDQSMGAFNVVKSMLEDKIALVASLRKTIEEKDAIINDLSVGLLDSADKIDDANETISVLRDALSKTIK